MPNGTIEPFHLAGLEWKIYEECLRIYLAANDIKETRKVTTVLCLLGGKTYKVLRNLMTPELPSTKSLEEIFATLTKHFCPKPSTVAERYRFSQRFQKEGETFSEFIAELREMSQHCKFGTSLEERICDQFVIGLRSSDIRQRLFQEMDISLDRALIIACSMDLSLKDATEINPSNALSGSVQQISRNVRRKKLVSRPSTSRTSFPNCTHCGRTSHAADSCPLKEATCFNCKRKGHISSICRSKSGHDNLSNKMAATRKIYSDQNDYVDQSDDSDTDGACANLDHIMIGRVKGQFVQPIMLELIVNNIMLKMELDTGAAVSVIPEDIYEKYFPNIPLRSPGIVLSSFTGEKYIPTGKIVVSSSYKGKIINNLDLFVVKHALSPLLGRSWIDKLDILQTVCNSVSPCLVDNSAIKSLDILLRKHAPLFSSSLGKIKIFKAHLSVKEGSQPRFFKARPVPYALRPALEAALVQLERQGIITAIPSSDWAAPIVPIQKKDKSLRLCGDYKVGLNPVLNLDFYPLPRIEDMFAQLSGGVIFSKLDLAQAYQQMELDDDSKKFCTINTIKGLYQVNRLPFGITSAPVIFQKTMEQILFGLKGIMCYLDDILVTGTSLEGHLSNLDALLSRLEDYGIHLNKAKCEFLQEKVEYLGHFINKDGLHASPSKIAAVLEAPPPKCVSDLRAFLGLINYYRKFLPNLSTVLAPLNQLLQKGTSWSWSTVVNSAFQKAKDLISSPVVLTHFDPQLPVVLACDASSFGLGVVISHRYPDGSERPIAFASRSLSSAERGYAQIDKEALSIIFGVKRFHQFLFGRRFTLLTDHQPLTRLFGPKNAIPTLAASRLQRWAIVLSSYNYEIVYRNTKAHGNADALSRAPLPLSAQVLGNEEELPADFSFISQMELFPVDYKDIAKATRKDSILSEVLVYTSSGWPDSVNKDLTSYFNRQEEISLQHGCLLWGVRVIIPLSLRARILDELHLQHTGTVKMKMLARSYFWWPGLDEEIGKITKLCPECLLQSNCPEKSPLHPWNWPTKPWQRIHIDFAGPFQGTNFLVVVDAHSKWPEVFSMKSTTTTRTIEILNSLVARYGIPEHIVSDNGPQFVSEEFRLFCQSYGIKHTRSAPFHPSTNGQAERFVQVLKKNLKKSVQDVMLSQRINRLLLTYRSTPHCTTAETPAYLFLGRQIRIRLDLLRPSPAERVHFSQDKQTLRSDRGKVKEKFAIDQPVLARDFRNIEKWQPAVVVSATGPLSYLVRLDTGQLWKRHQDQLISRSLPLGCSPTPVDGHLKDSASVLKKHTPPSEIQPRHNPIRAKARPARLNI